MAEKTVLGIKLAMRLVGIMMTVIGLLMAYYTYFGNSLTGLTFNFFIGIGIFLMVIGVIIIISRINGKSD